MVIYKFCCLFIKENQKKAAINSVNNKDKCFQYSATVALNLEEIGKDPLKTGGWNLNPLSKK